jgi:voltage-gated sodium channel
MPLTFCMQDQLRESSDDSADSGRHSGIKSDPDILSNNDTTAKSDSDALSDGSCSEDGGEDEVWEIEEMHKEFETLQNVPDEAREANIKQTLALLREALQNARMKSSADITEEEPKANMPRRFENLNKELLNLVDIDHQPAKQNGFQRVLAKAYLAWPYSGLGSQSQRSDAGSPRRACMNTPGANAFFGGVIMLNALFIGVETDLRDTELESSSEWLTWFVLDAAFLIIFIVELSLRLCMLARLRDAYRDYWNIFDTTFVVLGVFDTFFLQVIAPDKGGLVRFIRLVRLLRVLRIVRLFRYFKELTLLAQGIWGALQSMIWAALLICVLIYVCAVVMTNTLGRNKAGKIPDWFGSLGSSLFTLFQLMTLEDWPSVVRPCMDAQSLVWIFFIPFMMFMNFAMLNVITAVVVEKVVTIARTEAAEEAKNAEKKRRHLLRKIKLLFSMIGTDGGGEISLAQFRQALKQPDILALFMELGIGKYEADDLFVCLDMDGGGTLSEAEFVEGCLRVHGPAQSKHLLQVQYDIFRSKEAMQSDLGQLSWYVRWIIKHLSNRYDWKKYLEVTGSPEVGDVIGSVCDRSQLSTPDGTEKDVSGCEQAEFLQEDEASAAVAMLRGIRSEQLQLREMVEALLEEFRILHAKFAELGGRRNYPSELT